MAVPAIEAIKHASDVQETINYTGTAENRVPSTVEWHSATVTPESTVRGTYTCEGTPPRITNYTEELI